MVRTQSDGAVNHRDKEGYAIAKHRFKKAAYYVVTVRRSNNHGHQAVDKLDVRIDFAD